jgi:hypothetical protein
MMLYPKPACQADVLHPRLTERIMDTCHPSYKTWMSRVCTIPKFLRNGFQAFFLHERQQLQRRPMWVFLATFPFAYQARCHV